MSTTRFTLVAVLLATGSAAAQATPAGRDSARWTVGATQLRAGGLRLGLGSLNADLSRNGRPIFSNTIPSFGISTYARKGRILFGASADGSLPRRGAQGGWVTKLGAGSATLDGGAGSDLLVANYSGNTYAGTAQSTGIIFTSYDPVPGNGRGAKSVGHERRSRGRNDQIYRLSGVRNRVAEPSQNGRPTSQHPELVFRQRAGDCLQCLGKRVKGLLGCGAHIG